MRGQAGGPGDLGTQLHGGGLRGLRHADQRPPPAGLLGPARQPGTSPSSWSPCPSSRWCATSRWTARASTPTCGGSRPGSPSTGPGTCTRGPRASRPREWAANYLYSRCMTCGICMAACPQFGPDSDFLGPATLAQVCLINAHPTGRYDRAERLHAIMGEGGLSDCGNAQNCVRVCPKEIPLTTAIGELGPRGHPPGAAGPLRGPGLDPRRALLQVRPRRAAWRDRTQTAGRSGSTRRPAGETSRPRSNACGRAPRSSPMRRHWVS